MGLGRSDCHRQEGTWPCSDSLICSLGNNSAGYWKKNVKTEIEGGIQSKAVTRQIKMILHQ